MEPAADEYADFVEHPRFGKGPRFTGLNPPPFGENVNLHWQATTLQEVAAQYEAVLGKAWPYGEMNAESARGRRVPNTAIEADVSRQRPATVPVTHYFDLQRVCRDCGRPFIFFAAEQKHWYEELGFPLESDCVRCVDCRKKQQKIKRLRKRYEELLAMADRTAEQTVELAESCLMLIEDGVFSVKQTQRVRTLLNAIRADATSRCQSQITDLTERTKAIEAGSAGQSQHV
jgi:hypothetical protein